MFLREAKTRNNRSRTHNGSRRNNQPENRALASFTCEVPSVGTVFGTVSEQHSTNYQFKTFQNKSKQYVLRDFDNPRDIIIVVGDLKDLYSHVDMDKPINNSKSEK